MKHVLLASSCLAVAACMTPANPPSLLPRAIETATDASAGARPPVVRRAIEPAVAAAVRAALAEAEAGDAEFVRIEAGAQSALAGGRSAAPGGEAWIAAELVRSALQVARQRSANALASIDSLAIEQHERASRDPATGGLDVIDTARSTIEAIVDRQTAQLAMISS